MAFRFRKNKDLKGKTKYKFVFVPIAFDFSILWQILALLISWGTYKSVGWAFIHTIFGIWYVIYWILTGSNANEEGIIELINYWKNIFK